MRNMRRRMRRDSAPATASSTIRDRLALTLMIVSAGGAGVAALTSIGDVAAAGPATQQVEAWRLWGFVMFAGVFALLAVGPRRYPGLWELAIADKAALTVTEALLVGRHAANAPSSAIIDGVLTIVLLASYLLSRGYAGWRMRPPGG